MTIKRAPASAVSRAARSCLGTLLAAELANAPVEFHSWRAANAKKIPLLDELKRGRMLEGDTHCGVTFWGLMNAPGERARAAMSKSERAFKVLRSFYPRHPRESLALDELAKLAKMSQQEALQSARFLSRSPLSLSVNSLEQGIRVSPNENYVTARDFKAVKEQTRELGTRIVPAGMPSLLGIGNSEPKLTWTLELSESEVVRECWQKALGRLYTDPAGSITAAKSLVEAACKHVIEEFNETDEGLMELPKLHKKATELLNLHPRHELDDSLRRVLRASATIVDGLAYIRNKLGDAHGKGREPSLPARRHAEFAVMIAPAIAGLLLSTLDAQRTP